MSQTKTLGLSEKLSGGSGEFCAGQLALLYSPCCLACCLPVAVLHPLSTAPEHCPPFSCSSGSAAAKHSVVVVQTAALLLCKWLRAVWGCSSSVWCLEAGDRGAGGAGPSSPTRQPDAERGELPCERQRQLSLLIYDWAAASAGGNAAQLSRQQLPQWWWWEVRGGGGFCAAAVRLLLLPALLA